jgi:phosphotransacetylase
MYFSNCPTGGLVVGTNKAVTFSSRSDSADTKFHTLALGVLMS